MDNDLLSRRNHALTIARSAASTALDYFTNIEKLVIEAKGKQDLVSDADKAVEKQIREALRIAFSHDGIIGEEYGDIASKTGYTWVIDPIDGTSSFVNGIPNWCVVLACVYQGATVIGVIIDPVADETYLSVKGHGATLNGRPIKVSSSSSLADGSTAVGFSTRIPIEPTLHVLHNIMQAGGIYYRSGSGALMLAYVAAGRLIGFCEQHMNAWDCIAAILMIEEAGGEVASFSMARMLESGGKVVASCPGVYSQLSTICEKHFTT